MTKRPVGMPILVLLLCLVPAASGSGAAQEQEPSPADVPEIGWQADPGGHAGRDPYLPGIGVSFTWSQLTAEDERDTYGSLPTWSLRLSWPTGARTLLYLMAAYATRSGDPYYAEPTFGGENVSRLRTVPVGFGFRADMDPHSVVSAWFGGSLLTAWAEEESPSPSGLTSEGRSRSSGWLHGFELTLGPQWRSHDDKRALGLEFAYRVLDGGIGSGSSRRDLDLAAWSIRAYYAIQP
jgi:hypothetical protein